MTVKESRASPDTFKDVAPRTHTHIGIYCTQPCVFVATDIYNNCMSSVSLLQKHNTYNTIHIIAHIPAWWFQSYQMISL